MCAGYPGVAGHFEVGPGGDCRWEQTWIGSRLKASELGEALGSGRELRRQGSVQG